MITEEERTCLAKAYADQALRETNPMLACSTYRRALKMASPCFTGNDIEKAYLAGLTAVLSLTLEK